MEQRIQTAGTVKLTTAQSSIRSEIGNFPSGPTKYTVVHRRPVSTLLPAFVQPSPQKTSAQVVLPNTMCRYVQHPALTKNEKAGVLSASLVNQKSSEKSTRPTESRSKAKPTLKRSLSADHLDVFQPAPAKRPFPVQIWFNSRKSGPRPLVATAFWLDSPLHDSQAFVYTKLLEASQARRYLRLQSKPRKYLHLTGGGIVAINPSPPSNRKLGIVLPPMTVKVLPVKQPNSIIDSPSKIKKPNIAQLPPPPPLISLRPPVVSPKVERPDSPQQEQPLELCKRRKHSSGSPSPSPESPVVTSSAPSSPLNLAVRAIVTSANTIPPSKRKTAVPPPFNLSNEVLKNQFEPLDLATPSPTTALNKLSLTDSSPKSPTLDVFRRRLLLVLQVLIGKTGMNNLGFPQASLDEVLVRYLKKAGVTPAAKDQVKNNWMKFLRLCVKSEDAWKNEGWDRKTPDAILDEIYLQGKHNRLLSETSYYFC